MMLRRGLCVLTLALAGPVSHADTSYIIDQLVVGVTSAPDAEGERVAQVKSGDKLEVIERQGDETHVKLSNGKDGWIKSSYLTTDPPLQARLGERTAQVQKLEQEGDRLKQDVSRLQRELAAARAVRSATSDAPPPPAPTHDSVFLREPERQTAVAWPLLLGSCALMLLVGFVAGWRTLDRRIRRKYGGLKIY
jgi:hypothetical protein